MQQEKWEQLLCRIFVNPAGRMRLERSVRPRLLEEKTHYSGRLGGDTGIEKVYSDTETVDMVKLSREDEAGDWIEMDVSALG